LSVGIVSFLVYVIRGIGEGWTRVRGEENEGDWVSDRKGKYNKKRRRRGEKRSMEGGSEDRIEIEQ
jgi:hypothetical protein